MCLLATLSPASRIFSPVSSKDDGLLGRLAHLVLQGLLELLAFFDHRVQLLGNLLIIALLESGALLVHLAQFVIALGLDLGDLGIDACGLLTLGDGDFIFETLQGLLAGFFVHIGDDVLGKIQHTVQVAARNIQQHSQLGGDAPRVPDVRNRRGQRDVSHALAADRGAGYFHAAFVADDSFVTGVLVFAAITLPVTGRAKNGLTEQPVFFRPQAAIVDRFGFEHFAIRP